VDQVGDLPQELLSIVDRGGMLAQAIDHRELAGQPFDALLQARAIEQQPQAIGERRQ